MKKAIFAVLGLAAVLSLLMASVGCASPGAGPSIQTDKQDYQPEEIVTISGTGFSSGPVALIVTRPDGEIDHVPDVSADRSGNFTATYQLDGIMGTYIVDATDCAGQTAQTTFTDGSNNIYIGSQAGTLTYGTLGSVTYSITVTGEGGGWTKLFIEGLPSGTTASFSPTDLQSPWPAYSTLTIDYDGTTPAGMYPFCVGESPSGKPPAQHQICTKLTIGGGTCTDADGDGHGVGAGCTGPEDCDDSDPTTYPGAPELCDGKDNDCDGVVPDNENDSDGDGALDCNDGCRSDPDKTEPGICGCGVPDIDSDGDGQVDCVDLCPDDPAKTAPGACGCGVADTDSDGDGTPDCIDGCPSDPDKIAPGICGCDVPDTDTDGDGIPDCVDPTPGGQPIVPQPKTWYVLRTNSTEGGEVTRPRWGIAPYLAYYRKAYHAGEEVNLEATPDAGYRFVNWTGDVDTIADVNAACTTIIMNGFYEIRANFELET